MADEVKIPRGSIVPMPVFVVIIAILTIVGIVGFIPLIPCTWCDYQNFGRVGSNKYRAGATNWRCFGCGGETPKWQTDILAVAAEWPLTPHEVMAQLLRGQI